MHKDDGRWRGVVHFARLGVSLACVSFVLSGCTMQGSSGPRLSRVERSVGAPLDGAQIMMVDVTDGVARHVIAAHRNEGFAETFGDLTPIGQVIGAGDTLDISIWEAPPAALFGSAGGTMAASASTVLAPSVMQNSNLPPQVVAENGMIMIPFAGQIRASGRTPQQLEQAIVSALNGKAHMPQVMVRLTEGRSSSVTVAGDVAHSVVVPLTPMGERLLDVLARAGGAQQPVGKMTIRVTRDGRSVSQPLEAILLDPAQNIRLRPGDVVTALHQPYSFTALGAVGTNAEIPFEGTGLTLAQALGRIGGLRDDRADARGVFIFRLENPDALGVGVDSGQRLTPDGRLPVIYKIDLSDPASFFVAQGFPIRNGDVVYISNAPLADLQKFVGMVSSMAFSIIGVGNAVR